MMAYCIYVCMVITYSRVWINRVRLPILLVVSWTGKMNISLSCPRTRLRIWSRETGSHGIPPDFRGGPFIYLSRHTPSGQSRVYRVTQLGTDGVHCRESASTGALVLKVVPVTGVAMLQVTMDQLMCASLFRHPGMLIEGGTSGFVHGWFFLCVLQAGRLGSSEVPRNPLTCWDVSSIPANGIFLTKKTKKQK